ADTGTRLLLTISNVPLSAQVYAPVASINNQGRLVNANADGLGGTFVTGAPRASGTYAQITILSGAGTATYEIVTADTHSIDGLQLPLLFENATNAQIDQIQFDAALAPFSSVAIANATAPVPRFADPSHPSAQINLRLRGTVQSAGSRPVT